MHLVNTPVITDSLAGKVDTDTTNYAHGAKFTARSDGSAVGIVYTNSDHNAGRQIIFSGTNIACQTFSNGSYSTDWNYQIKEITYSDTLSDYDAVGLSNKNRIMYGSVSGNPTTVYLSFDIGWIRIQFRYGGTSFQFRGIYGNSNSGWKTFTFS